MNNARPVFFSILLGASFILAPSILRAGDFSPDSKEVVIEDPAKAVVFEDSGRWSITGGATVRSIDAGFQLDASKAGFSWHPFVSRKTGRGNRGLYQGGAPIHYDDGIAGPDYAAANPGFAGPVGDTVGIIRSNRQINQTGRVDNFGFPISQVEFHTEGFDYLGSVSGGPLRISDSDTGVGPYLRLSYLLNSNGNRFLNLVTGWSFISTDHGTGYTDAGHLAVTETRTRHTYSHDYLGPFFGPGDPIPLFDEIGADGNGGARGAGGGGGGGVAFDLIGPPPGPNVPSGSIDLSDSGGIIYDVATARVADGGLIPGLTGYQDPRQRESVSHRTVAHFYAMSRADLDVDLNEVPVGLEFGCQAGPVDLFLTAGATLNVINFDLENRVDWYQAGRSGPVARQMWRDSGSPVKVGLYGGIGARCPLTGDGRVFFEANGSYRWVDSVHASAGIADVEIDVSSFEGRLGIGIILD